MLEEFVSKKVCLDLKCSVIRTVDKCFRKKKDITFTINKLIEVLESDLGFRLGLTDIRSRKTKPDDLYLLFIEDSWRIKFPYGSLYVTVELNKKKTLPDVVTPYELRSALKPNLKLDTLNNINRMYLRLGLKMASFTLFGGKEDVPFIEVDYFKYKPMTLTKPEHREFVFNIPRGKAKVYELDEGYVIIMDGFDRMAFLVQTDRESYAHMQTKQLIETINKSFESIGRQIISLSIIKDSISFENYKKPKSPKYDKLDPSQMSVLKKGDDFILYIHNTLDGLYHVSTRKIPKA